jgi:uncharacterized protein with HEPN domain
MSKDPTIAIQDCLAEIGVLLQIAARMTLQTFRSDPIVRRAAAYAIQTISEAVRHVPGEWLVEFPTEPWGQEGTSVVMISHRMASSIRKYS